MMDTCFSASVQLLTFVSVFSIASDVLRKQLKKKKKKKCLVWAFENSFYEEKRKKVPHFKTS